MRDVKISGAVSSKSSNRIITIESNHVYGHGTFTAEFNLASQKIAKSFIQSITSKSDSGFKMYDYETENEKGIFVEEKTGYKFRFVTELKRDVEYKDSVIFFGVPEALLIHLEMACVRVDLLGFTVITMDQIWKYWSSRRDFFLRTSSCFDDSDDEDKEWIIVWANRFDYHYSGQCTINTDKDMHESGILKIDKYFLSSEYDKKGQAAKKHFHSEYLNKYVRENCFFGKWRIPKQGDLDKYIEEEIQNEEVAE